jgi:hypothetical protein
VNNRAGAVGHATSAGTIAIDWQPGPGTFGAWTHIVDLGNSRLFFYNQYLGSGGVGHVTTAGHFVNDGNQGPGTFGSWVIVTAL